MDKKRSSLFDWLGELQRESWNMELLISGFSIFLLLQTGPAINSFNQWLNVNYEVPFPVSAFLFSFLAVLKIGATLLVVNMVFHVMLRGFWIGAIGLRSIQERVHYPGFGYTTFFTQKLIRNAVGLDKLITRTDQLASAIFAFSFLTIFMLFSLFAIISFFVGLNYGFSLISSSLGYKQEMPAPFVILLFAGLAGSALYAIDTLTFGLIKKIPWFDRVYYPLYVFMGYITFSFLYRNIYYSLLSRLKNWKSKLLLSLYIVMIFLTPFFRYEQAIFFPDDTTSANFKTSYYDNLRPKGQSITHASIPSQIVKGRYLPLFIRYNVKHNSAIRQWCSGYEPTKKEGIISGIKFRGGMVIDPPFVREKDPRKLLQCLSTFYNVYLDNKHQQQLEFWYYEHPGHKEKGIYAVIDLQGLQTGRHTLAIRRKSVNVTPEIKDEEYATIPFWIE